jgi:hypothetical protein
MTNKLIIIATVAYAACVSSPKAGEMDSLASCAKDAGCAQYIVARLARLHLPIDMQWQLEDAMKHYPEYKAEHAHR